MRCSLPPLQCYEGTSAAGARSDSPLRFWMQQSSCERGREPRVTPSGTSGVTLLAHESLPRVVDRRGRSPRSQLGLPVSQWWAGALRGLRWTVTCGFSFRLRYCGLGCHLITKSSESASTVTRGTRAGNKLNLNEISLKANSGSRLNANPEWKAGQL